MPGVRFWGRPETTCRRKFRYIRDHDGSKFVLVKHRDVDHLQRVALARKLIRMKYALETDRIHRVESSKKLSSPFHENLHKFLVKKKKTKFCRLARRKRREVKFHEEGKGSSNTEGPSSVDATNEKLAADCKKYQTNKWKRKILKTANTPEVLQVLANRRVFIGFNDAKPGLLTPLLESMQTAVYSHDWPVACKCAEGLADICKRNSTSGYWLLWNGGFLALASGYKNDVNRLVDFAEFARVALGAYPKRLGIEVGTWLTQKGYFRRGRDLINYWHEKWGKSLVFKRSRYRTNPKRNQVELIAALVDAVYTYSCWKRGCSLLDVRQADGFGARHVGELALAEFQAVMEAAQQVDADVTVFVEPLIELTAEFRTEFAAREIFLDLVIKHERNFVLEQMYLEFLRKTFPFLEEELELFTERQKLYNLGQREDDDINVRRLRQWKRKMIKKQQGVTFGSRQVPMFSL